MPGVNVGVELEGLKNFETLECCFKLQGEDANEVGDGQLLEIEKDGLRDDGVVCRWGYFC